MALLTRMPMYIQSQGFSGLEGRLGITAMFGRPTTTMNRPGGVVPGYAGQFAVTAGPGLAVTVATGAAQVTGGSAGQADYILTADEPTILDLAEADPSSARVDAVIIRIRDDEWGDDLEDTGPYLDIVTGVPGAGAPSMPAGATVLKLAEVTVAAGATTVSGGGIADKRRWSVAAGGVLPCTSSDKPTAGYPGLEIYQTDNGRKARWDGTGWVDVPFLPAFLELTRLDASYQSIGSGSDPADKMRFNRLPRLTGFTVTPPISVTDITIPSGYAGEYLFTITAPFYGGGDGAQRVLQVWREFEIFWEDRRPPITSSTLPTVCGGAGMVTLAAGDTLYATVYQDDGSAIQLGYDTVLPRFTLKRMSEL